MWPHMKIRKFSSDTISRQVQIPIVQNVHSPFHNEYILYPTSTNTIKQDDVLTNRSLGIFDGRQTTVFSQDRHAASTAMENLQRIPRPHNAHTHKLQYSSTSPLQWNSYRNGTTSTTKTKCELREGKNTNNSNCILLFCIASRNRAVFLFRVKRSNILPIRETNKIVTT